MNLLKTTLLKTRGQRLYVILSIFLTLLTSQHAAAQSSCTSELEWSTLGFFDEEAFPPFYTTTVDATSVTLSWSLITDGGVLLPYAGFDYVSFDTTAVSVDTGYLSMGIDNDENDPDDYIELTISFASPVSGLRFDIEDIDNQSDTIFPPAWQDAVEVLYNGSNNVVGTSFYTAGPAVALDDETYMTGFEGTNAFGVGSTGGNLSLDFGSTAISSFTIRYRVSDDAALNPGGQLIALGDLFWGFDDADPVLSGVPANVAVDCGSIPSAASPTATDNCDPSPTISFDESTSSGCPYTITRTWTATDATGNSSSQAQIITVDDNESPVLIGVPANITVDCGSVPPASSSVTASDNCDVTPDVNFIETVVSTSPLILSRTWIAADDCGNSISGSQQVLVVDTTAPVVISGPADFTTDCGSSLPAPPDPVFTDNCDTMPTVSFEESFSGACPSVATRIWTITDASGNFTTHVQQVTFTDTTPPTLVGVPSNTTVLCTSVGAASTVTAVDDCDTAVSVSFTESYAEGCPIMITRTWTAVDTCGNSVSASQVVTAIDIVDPILVGVPADTTISCSDSVPVAATVTAIDGCDPTVSLFYNETVTDSLITRLWTTIDDCGNSTLGIQKITIEDGGSGPVFSAMPADTVVDCATVPAAATLTAVDGFGAALSVNFTETTSGSCPAILTRTWEATDACGNIGVVTQTLTVEDNDAPVLSGYPMDTIITCGDAIPAAPTIVAIDNCDPAPSITFSESFIGFDSIGDCDYSILRIWNAMDDCSNAVLHNQVIEINSPLPNPPVALDDNLTVNEDDMGSIDLSLNDMDPDGDLINSSVTLLSTLPASQGTLVNNGDGSVTFTPAPNYDGSVDAVDYVIFDGLSLSDTATLQLTIIPINDPPTAGIDAVVICFGSSLLIDVLANDMDIDGTLVPSSLTIVTPPVTGTATALASGLLSYVQDGVSFGPNVVQYSVQDDQGATVNGIVNILTFAPPVLSAVPADDSVLCGAVPAPPTITATDYFGASLSVNLTENLINYSGAGDCDYQVERIWSTTDTCGNSAMDSQLISVTPPIGNDPPVAINDSITTCIGGAVSVNVLFNDSDPDGSLDLSSLSLIGSTFPGIATANTDGTIDFSHDGITAGPVTISYSIADNEGATATADLVVDFFSNIGLSLQGIDATCGQSDGSVDLTVTSGAAPFMYLWSTGATTQDLSGVPAGNYSVTVTDLNGCENTSNYNVGESGQMALAGVTTFAASSCTSSDGSVLIDLDDANAGTPPYLIMINNTYSFGPFASEPIVLFGAPGRAKINNIKITDAVGCELVETNTYPIGEPDPPAVESITVIDPVCGVDTTGSIIIDLVDSLSGGPNYFVKLSNDIYGPFSSEPLVIDNLLPGVYQKPKVRDGNGCIYKGNSTHVISDCPPLRAELASTEEPVFYRNIWPNPSSGFTTINMELNYLAAVSLEVLDANGQVVYRQFFDSTISLDERVDLRALAAGMYSLKWTVDGKWIYQDKLIRVN